MSSNSITAPWCRCTSSRRAWTGPVVPVIFNTLASPQPTARRCLELGRVIGEVAAKSKKRIGLIATGGLSHDPGEKNHGIIDTEFDRHFLAAMVDGDAETLSRYTRAEFAKAGAGAFELLSWVALVGALGGRKGEVVAYEAVKPWATGVGLMTFNARARGVRVRRASMRGLANGLPPRIGWRLLIGNALQCRFVSRCRRSFSSAAAQRHVRDARDPVCRPARPARRPIPPMTRSPSRPRKLSLELTPPDRPPVLRHELRKAGESLA